MAGSQPLAAGEVHVPTADRIVGVHGADRGAAGVAVSCWRLAEHAPGCWALGEEAPAQRPHLPSDNDGDAVVAVSCLPASQPALLAPVLVTASSQAVSLLQLGALDERPLRWRPVLRVEPASPLAGGAQPTCSVHSGPLLAVHIPGHGLLLSWQAPGAAAAAAAAAGAAAAPGWTSHLLPEASLPAGCRPQVLSSRLSSSGCTAWLAAASPDASQLLRVWVPAGEGAAQVAAQQAAVPSVSCSAELPRDAAGSAAGSAPAAVEATAACGGAADGAPLLLLGSAAGAVGVYDASSGCCGPSITLQGPVRQLALLQQLALCGATRRGVVAALHGPPGAGSLTLLCQQDLQQLATIPGVGSIVHSPWLGRLPAAPGSGSGTAGLALLAALAQSGQAQAAALAEQHGAVVVEHQGAELLGFLCTVGARSLQPSRMWLPPHARRAALPQDERPMFASVAAPRRRQLRRSSRTPTPRPSFAGCRRCCRRSSCAGSKVGTARGRWTTQLSRARTTAGQGHILCAALALTCLLARRLQAAGSCRASPGRWTSGARCWPAQMRCCSSWRARAGSAAARRSSSPRCTASCSCCANCSQTAGRRQPSCSSCWILWVPLRQRQRQRQQGRRALRRLLRRQRTPAVHWWQSRWPRSATGYRLASW
jgi:hypothetical protein